MKKSLFVILFTVIVISLKAQIGGLSASKLANYNTSPVALHTIEFEPAFAINRTEIADTALFGNSFGFRFTYGLSKNIESGFVVPVDVSCLQYGIKYKIFQSKKISAALMSGVNFDFTRKNYLKNLGLGSIVTLDYTDKISSDFNLAFVDDFNGQGFDYQVLAGADNGVYIGNVQYILGLNYLYLRQKNNFSQNLFLSPGITVEPAHNFLFVISLPVSVYRKNDVFSSGFTFALTITID